LGIKSDLFDRRLRVNLAGFINDYKNIQLPISDCSLLDGFAPGTDPFPCAASKMPVTAKCGALKPKSAPARLKVWTSMAA
jgi:hypothetical protein